MKLMVFVFLVCAGVSFADYQIVATIDAPDTNISGLGFGDGSLWAVDGVTEYAYQLDPLYRSGSEFLVLCQFKQSNNRTHLRQQYSLHHHDNHAQHE